MNLFLRKKMKQNIQKIVIVGLFLCLGLILYLLTSDTKEEVLGKQQNDVSTYKAPKINLDKTNKQLEVLTKELDATQKMLDENSVNNLQVDIEKNKKDLEKLRLQIEESKKSLKSLSK